MDRVEPNMTAAFWAGTELRGGHAPDYRRQALRSFDNCGTGAIPFELRGFGSERGAAFSRQESPLSRYTGGSGSTKTVPDC